MYPPRPKEKTTTKKRTSKNDNFEVPEALFTISFVQKRTLGRSRNVRTKK